VKARLGSPRYALMLSILPPLSLKTGPAPLIKNQRWTCGKFARVYNCGGLDLSKEQKFRRYLLHGEKISETTQLSAVRLKQDATPTS